MAIDITIRKQEIRRSSDLDLAHAHDHNNCQSPATDAQPATDQLSTRNSFRFYSFMFFISFARIFISQRGAPPPLDFNTTEAESRTSSRKGVHSTGSNTVIHATLRLVSFQTPTTHLNIWICGARQYQEGKARIFTGMAAGLWGGLFICFAFLFGHAQRFLS